MRQDDSNQGIVIKNKLFLGFNYLLLTMFVIALLLPIYIIFNVSLKTGPEYAKSSLLALPNSLYLDNYLTAIKAGKLFVGLKNTLLYCFIGIAGKIIFGPSTAYIFSRFEFKFKKIIFMAFVGAQLIPTSLTAVATFMVIKNLGLYNKFSCAIVIYGMGVDIITIFLMLQFLKKIPKSLDESARVEGASYFKIYTIIIFPQLKTPIATVAIFTFVGIYNDFLTPYLYIPKPALRTIATALNTFSGDRMTNWPVMSAAIMVTLIPILLVYLKLQKHIIAGLSDGAVKE